MAAMRPACGPGACLSPPTVGGAPRRRTGCGHRSARAQAGLPDDVLPTAHVSGQVPALTSRWARRAVELTALIGDLGVVAAGRAGSAVLTWLGMTVSRS